MVYGGADRKEMVPALMRIIAAQQNDKSPGGVCLPEISWTCLSVSVCKTRLGPQGDLDQSGQRTLTVTGSHAQTGWNKNQTKILNISD